MRRHIYSLLACFVLMCVTAVCVNKTLFGIPIEDNSVKVEKSEQADVAAESDAITYLEDGTAVINTTTLSNMVGYSGTTPLEVYVKDDVITDIKALPNTETPPFFERASALFDSWIGKSVEDAQSLQVDAVSGATFSSTAIIANVNAATEAYLDVKASPASPAMPWKMWVAFAVTLCACIVPLFVKNKIYNYVQMGANIIVLGFWCGQFLDYAAMLKYLSYGVSFPVGLTAVAMLVAAFVYPLFGKKQYYCNHICPLGSAQILVASICKYKVKIGKRTLQILDSFRKVLWCVLLVLIWFDIYAGWLDLELFQAFMVESAPVVIIVIAALFVALSSIVARPYCRFVCPTGTLMKQSEGMR